MKSLELSNIRNTLDSLTDSLLENLNKKLHHTRSLIKEGRSKSKLGNRNTDTYKRIKLLMKEYSIYAVLELYDDINDDISNLSDNEYNRLSMITLNNDLVIDSIIDSYDDLVKSELGIDYDVSYNGADMKILKTLSYRIHLGLHVAEAKYQDDPKMMQAAIDSGNDNNIKALLVRKDREIEILQEVRDLSRRYKDLGNAGVNLYEKLIIPITLGLEVSYLKEMYGAKDNSTFTVDSSEVVAL